MSKLHLLCTLLSLLSLTESVKASHLKPFVSKCVPIPNHDNNFTDRNSSREKPLEFSDVLSQPAKISLPSSVPRGGSAIEQVKTVQNSISAFLDMISKTKNRCWGTLLFAVVVETYATTKMKIASDSSNVVKLLEAMSLYMGSLFFFYISLRQIEMSISYAVWSALGTAFVAFFGMTIFGEAVNMKKIVGLGLIALGVVVLNLEETH